MKKNYKILYFDKNIIKYYYYFFFKNKKIIGKNQVFFKKFYYIFNNFYNNNIYVYNGYKFRFLKINFFFFGLRFGNFVFTKKPFKYYIKKKNLKKIKKR